MVHYRGYFPAFNKILLLTYIYEGRENISTITSVS